MSLAKFDSPDFGKGANIGTAGDQFWQQKWSEGTSFGKFSCQNWSPQAGFREDLFQALMQYISCLLDMSQQVQDQTNSNAQSDALNSPADSQAKYILAEAGLSVDPLLLAPIE